MSRFPRALASALTLSLGLSAAPALAFDIDAMSPEERAAFGDEVRAYLLENPEVLMEAIAVLERRDAEAQVANDSALVEQNRTALLEDDFSLVTGNPEGDIVLIEFMDYRCGYCRRAAPEVAELLSSDGNIKMISKEFPILGEASTLSARFAMSTKLVEGDEAYGEMHEALMTLRGEPSEAVLTGLAGDMGLDGAAIWDGMDDARIDEVIETNYALAQRLQISGTPTFVLGDQLLRGYVPLEGMRAVVAQVRDAQDG